MKRQFVGRVSELQALHAAVDAAVQGRGRLLLLSGEPGIGKTRTAEEIVSYAEARGALVLWGRCYESEGAPALWPWAQIIRAGSQELSSEELRDALGHGASLLAALVPAVGQRLASGAELSFESAETRFLLFDAVRNLVEVLSRRAPLLIVIDDLHGADPSSLLLLQFLTQHAARMPLLLLGTHRDAALSSDHPLNSTLVEALRAPGTERLALRGWSEAEVAEYLEASTGAPPAVSTTKALFERTEGNPLLVGEFVRAWIAEQGTPATSAAPPPTPLAVPRTVRAILARRLSPLSSACRQMLRVAAVAGREFRRDVVARAFIALLAANGEVPSASAAELIASAEALGIVAALGEPPSRYRFSHALIREALYDELAPHERAEAHRHVGEALAALADADDMLAELAYHFFEGSGEDDTPAIAYSRRAGDRAHLLRAHEEAARLYQLGVTALERRGEDADQRQLCEMLLALGEAQNRSGEVALGKQTFLRAASTARSVGDRSLLAAAALGYGGALTFPEGGYVDEVHVALLKEALATWTGEEHRLHACLLVRLATALYFTDQAPERAELSGRAVAMARRLGDPRTLAQVLRLAHSATWGPNAHERLGIADELVQLALRLADRGLAYQAHLLRLTDMLDLGRRDEIDVELEACRALAEELREPSQAGWVAMFGATLASLEGRFEEAERAATDLLLNGKWAGAAAEPIYAIQIYFIRYLQGRQEELIDPFRAAVAMNPGIPALRAALALLLAETGRHEEALAEVGSTLERLEEIPYGNSLLTTLAHLGHICALVGDARGAARVYERLRPHEDLSFTVANGTGYFGSIAYYLGLTARAMGDTDAALRHFEVALANHERMRARPYMALTRYEYAHTLATQDAPGDRERARELADAALTTATDLDMKVLESRARDLRDRLQGAPALPASNPHSPVFRRQADFWEVRYAGTEVRLKSSRGVDLMSRLLRQPGVGVHVLELMQASAGADRRGSRGRAIGDEGLPVLDEQAKRAYRERVNELRAELEEAQRYNDGGAAERAHAELEILTAQLSAAVGLGGRGRRAGAAAERARVAVTKRIKETIGRIREVHPALAEHLQASIRTGYICIYAPTGAPPEWQFA